jgi:tetratricopeptide (TPR) repeat protein
VSTFTESLATIDKLLDEKQYAIALSKIDSLISNYPEKSEIWRKRACLNEMRRQREAAVEDLTRAILLNPMEPDYYYTRGRIRCKLQHYEEAVADFTRTLDLCDHYKSDYYRAPAHFFRAETYVRLKKYDQARADCEHVPNGFKTWIDRMKSKEQILAECSAHG